MNFELVKRTKDEYKDSLHINSGNVFLTRRNGLPPYIFRVYLQKVTDSLNNLKNQEDFNNYLSERHMDHLADNYTRIIIHEFPNLKNDAITFNDVKKYCINGIYQNLFAGLSPVYKKAYNNKVIKNCIETNITRMIGSFNKQKTLFDSPGYWVAWGGVFYFYKEGKYDFNTIGSKFDNCTDTVKQYIMLRCLKDGIAFKENDKKKCESAFG